NRVAMLKSAAWRGPERCGKSFARPAATSASPRRVSHPSGRLMLHVNKIIVVMPAYHAEKTLAACYEAIPHDVVDEVLLVDDASDDATVVVARRLGIATHRHPANRGYGGNQKTCYALALAHGADIVVLLNPDYQYEPRCITAIDGT